MGRRIGATWRDQSGNDPPGDYDGGTVNQVKHLSSNGERHFGSDEVVHPIEEQFPLQWQALKTGAVGLTVFETWKVVNLSQRRKSNPSLRDISQMLFHVLTQLVKLKWAL
jgi:hypothetical protein